MSFSSCWLVPQAEVDFAGLAQGVDDRGFSGLGVPVCAGVDGGGEAVDLGEEEGGVFFGVRSGAGDFDVDGAGGGVDIVVEDGVFWFVAGGAEETPAGFRDGLSVLRRQIGGWD
jgi:hypothetical protein